MLHHDPHPQITRPLMHCKTFPLSETRHWYGDPINYRDPLHIAVALSHPRRVRPTHAHRSTRGRLWDIAHDRRTGGTTGIATDPRTSASFAFFAERAYLRWEADTLTPALRNFPPMPTIQDTPETNAALNRLLDIITGTVPFPEE